MLSQIANHPDLIQSGFQKAILFIGVAGMALGAIAIAGIGVGLGRESHHAVASFFVCAIAACLYLLMAFGQGVGLLTEHTILLHPTGLIPIAHARLEYFGRYIDWVFTTPLLLVGLIGVGMRSPTDGGTEARNRSAMMGAAIGADVLMIVTGVLAALSVNNTHKYVWFAVSCVFFLVVLAVVWGPVRTAALAEGGARAALYTRLLLVLTALWVIYPILWILGTEGTAAISLNAEVVVFAAIDLTAKVGFGLLLVTGVKKFGVSEESARAKAPAGARTAPGIA
jgi:bacteriorhodopsin